MLVDLQAMEELMVRNLDEHNRVELQPYVAQASSLDMVDIDTVDKRGGHDGFRLFWCERVGHP